MSTETALPGVDVEFTGVSPDSLASPWQHTLKSGFSCQGVGLHTGVKTEVRVQPAAPDRGRFFVRTTPAGEQEIPAQISAVASTTLCTELQCQGAGVYTVEHLLAALAGLGIDNARIEIDGPEVPLLDGSAQEWVQQILAVGGLAQPVARQSRRLTQVVSVQQGDAFALAIPAAETYFSYGIDFSTPAIGRQWFSFRPAEFTTAIAPARTFGLQEQIEQLQARGLIKGGSLDNALVCSQEGWLNPPLRFADEPVRHKLLDLLGDLSLLGSPLPPAHYLAYKASHALHTALAQAIALHLQVQLVEQVQPVETEPIQPESVEPSP
jgi:UDP-3-O-[3-hydroxymyristoyl] N-acetylglucosamine deacetylase